VSNCTGEGCTHPSHGSHNVLPFNPFVNPPKPEPQPKPIRIWRCRRFVPFWLFNLVMRRCNRTPQSFGRSVVRSIVAADVDRDLTRRIRLWLGKQKAKNLLIRWWNNDLPEVKENL
jgi:hypothetical protein